MTLFFSFATPPGEIHSDRGQVAATDALLPPERPAAADHDFHVSKCLVEYNEAERALQVSMHIFIDDLEEALRRQGADQLFICTEREAADAETHLQRYLEQNFRLQANGEPVAYEFLGKEISDDLAAVWCYLEVTGVDRLEQLTVTNRILTEVYDDQKNIVSVFGPGDRKGLLLFQRGKDTESVRF
jgi:hypothetical protein